jgi:hypothetical protein
VSLRLYLLIDSYYRDVLLVIDNLGSLCRPRANETIDAWHWGLALVVSFFLLQRILISVYYQHTLNLYVVF